MIEYNVWIDGITEACKFLADDNAVKKVWLEGNETITSIMDFDGLYEQIFDDLDADDFEKNEMRIKEKNLDRQKLISVFLESIRTVNTKIDNEPALRQAMVLLKSEEWTYVTDAALGIINEFKK